MYQFLVVNKIYLSVVHICIIVWLVFKRPRYELLGWTLHILIDIPSHSATFYPTPFLWPISDYRFLSGVSWSNPTYMVINYSLLAVVWTVIIVKYFKKKKYLQIQNFSVELFHWSRRSMDRTQLCGSCDAGSIPAEITKLTERKKAEISCRYHNPIVSNIL